MIPAWSKRLIHRHIVARPTLHEWQLNLYLAIERAPVMVLDYFPLDQVEDPRLRAAMKRHKAEEHKHERLFERALERIGGRDLSSGFEQTYNFAVAQHGCGYGARPLRDPRDLAQFLVHAHVIERRGLTSFRYHAEACRAMRLDDIVTDLDTVLADEERHVGYTREAVIDILGRTDGERRLREALATEARADVTYSRWFVEEFLRRAPVGYPTRGWRSFYRIGSALLKSAH